MAPKTNGYKSRNAARKRKKLEKSNRIGALIIALLLLTFGVVIWSRISVANDRINNLDQQIQDLEDQYQEQKERAISLEERKVYVQTKKYIEDVAKQLGLVYPDEIIYKPSK